MSVGQTKQGAGKAKTDREVSPRDDTKAVSGTVFTRGKDGALTDQTSMMDEKRYVDNELAKMKQKTILEHEIEYAKTPEERQKAKWRAAQNERDVKLQRG